jgi:hypothetical protein
MRECDLDDFDLYAAARPFREGRVGGASLCSGCTHSHIYRRRGSVDAFVYCHRLDRYVPPDIVECSEFRAVTALSLSQMQAIALPIDPRPGISEGSYR